MKKNLVFSIILALILGCFSSCSGYNRIMREYLSDPENYRTFEVVLDDIYYLDSDSHKLVNDFNVSEFLEYDMYFNVKFETYENLSVFIGGTPNTDTPIEECIITLRIISDNNKILYENGFYDKVSSGNKINITSSGWVYMDTEFHYISQVECDGVVYLNFEEGLKNIVNMMNNNKSLL